MSAGAFKTLNSLKSQHRSTFTTTTSLQRALFVLCPGERRVASRDPVAAEARNAAAVQEAPACSVSEVSTW